MIKTAALLISIVVAFNSQLAKFEAPDFLQMNIEARASELGLETSEFILFSSVVEAESNRSESLEGRILIAEVILNRLNDPRFGCESITEVLTAPGQFSTVRHGQSVTNRTDLSDEAVRIAISEVENGTAPAVLFFNCIGYNYGEPYGDGPIDGNYFMTLDLGGGE